VSGGTLVLVVAGAVVAVVLVVGAAVVVVVGAVVVVVVVGSVGSAAAQPVLVTVLVSRLTWPVRARRRPTTSPPVLAETDANAMIVPTKSVPVPSVAEEPTCQWTLHGLTPSSSTLLFDAVVSVEPI
jgi:hypothetical protein